MTTFRPLFAALGIVVSVCTYGESASRGYTNDVWIMKEGVLPVNDRDGKPANLHTNWSRRVGPAMLRIIWTSTIDFGWNYTTNTVPKNEGLPGRSIPVFLQEEFAAKSIIWTAIPDCPFRLATINGKFAPILWDTKKDVLWKLESLEQPIGNSDTIIVTSRKIELVQGGGDWFAFLTLDLSGGNKEIQVKYWERFDGY